MIYRRFAILLSTACGLLSASCDNGITCQDIGCQPSYTLHLEGPDEELQAGLWRVDLDIDGGTISAECEVTGAEEGPGDLICELGPWTNEPDQPVNVSVTVGKRIGPGSGEPTDTGVPPEESNAGIFVTLQSTNQEAPASSLGVEVSFEDASVFDTQLALTYEVEEDFGGEGCGSCIYANDEVILLP
ncbi:MAG: hypothetical protein ACE37F_19285 [Nannocystaceae bacterium]|nr:hypothetical protein [bacterium]